MQKEAHSTSPTFVSYQQFYSQKKKPPTPFKSPQSIFLLFTPAFPKQLPNQQKKKKFFYKPSLSLTSPFLASCGPVVLINGGWFWSLFRPHHLPSLDFLPRINSQLGHIHAHERTRLHGRNELFDPGRIPECPRLIELGIIKGDARV